MSGIDSHAEENDHINSEGLDEECTPEGAGGAEEAEAGDRDSGATAGDYDPFASYWTDGVGVQCVFFVFYVYRRAM